MKISKEIKAGAIAVLAIVGFVILFQFMKGKNVFSTENIYYAKYDDVEGISRSSAVSINGLKVGQVEQIIPKTHKNGKIYFVMKILVNDEFKFSKNSTLEIFEPGIMSGKQARINIVYDGATAKSGDTLSSGYKESMMNSLSSQVGPVKDQVESVLKKVDSLMHNANAITDAKNQAEIRALLSNLNRTVSAFENTSKQTNELLSHSDPRLQKVLDNANLATVSAKNAIDNYGKVAEDIDVQKLNSAIDKLSQTSDQLSKVIEGINNGEGSLGKLTKDEQLYQNLNKTAENLNALVEDMKANPKRYVNISVFGKNNK
ncbi:MAG: MlaD family protein [Cruoricaptor ignavus]|nr:MlaD family protein [Cruoricaptor ignavus]